MGKCAKSNCTKPTVGKETLCPDHLRLKKQDDQKQAQQKQQLEKQLKETEQKRKDAVEKAKKNELAAAAKTKKIGEIAALWNAEVKKIVKEVLKIREANKGQQGINAGNNGPLGTTLGGTNNPKQFTMPSNDHKITAAEVFAKMAGFENSDSGFFKFRVDGVLVHCK